MKNKLTPRFLIIALVIFWAVYALWPTVRFQTLSETEKETLRTEGKLNQLEARTIKQGLDLKGGMFIVLEVNLPTLMNNLAINKDAKFEGVIQTVEDQLKATPEADFFSLFAQAVADQRLKLSRYYYELGSDTKQILSSLKKEANDAIDRVLEILQNRVDQFGVSEPTIQKQGNQRIIVELAGVQDPERARALLESTALLEFYIVKDPEVTNNMLLRIDQVLKGNEDLTSVTADSSLEVQEPEEK
ncbi:MAG: protein translocase subunit SecD, partial [Fidelibacterota bacterium]